ncbi:hypothetical protein J1N35_008362 [Gossypium stocksii]|uniref:Uncharacterized protein n=1 Tax=Gossypium stocksii TaxID=47602 RepID=A0A9D3W7K7_9ROSI|nr:hypothetical protein J1N35_008362 [Gossypium stocksii]
MSWCQWSVIEDVPEDPSDSWFYRTYSVRLCILQGCRFSTLQVNLWRETAENKECAWVGHLTIFTSEKQVNGYCSTEFHFHRVLLMEKARFLARRQLLYYA